LKNKEGISKTEAHSSPLNSKEKEKMHKVQAKRVLREALPVVHRLQAAKAPMVAHKFKQKEKNRLGEETLKKENKARRPKKSEENRGNTKADTI
jgi:hypothetical protein